MKQTAEILEKARNYCSYQERYSKQISEKLQKWGALQEETDGIIEQLKAENFLNDTRFALLFARGKFNSRKWGRIKIRIELKLKGIEDNIIEKALKEIDNDDYYEALEELVVQKRKQYSKEKEVFKQNYKVAQSLARKGYESNLIWEVIKNSIP